MAVRHPGQEEAGKYEGAVSVEGRHDVASPLAYIPQDTAGLSAAQSNGSVFAESGSRWKVALCHVLAAASL